jgi:hypothetical protein
MDGGWDRLLNYMVDRLPSFGSAWDGWHGY